MARSSVTRRLEAAGEKPPKRADAVHNRQQILAAAEAAFAEEGVGVPVDEIARRAGVGAGTLYRHFPTKEALFEAVIVQHLEDLAAEATSGLTSDQPGAALFDFLAMLAEQGGSKRNIIDALAGAGIDVKAKASGALAKDELEAVAQKLLDRAQKAGEVRPDVTLSDLIGLVMGACTFAGNVEGSCSPSRMVAVVCDGLRTSR